MVGGETLCDGRESTVSRPRKSYKNPNNHGHVQQKKRSFYLQSKQSSNKMGITSEGGKAKITNIKNLTNNPTD